MVIVESEKYMRESSSFMVERKIRQLSEMGMLSYFACACVFNSSVIPCANSVSMMADAAVWLVMLCAVLFSSLQQPEMKRSIIINERTFCMIVFYRNEMGTISYAELACVNAMC